MADFVNPNIDQIVAALQTVRKIKGFGEQSVNSTRHVQLYDQATLCSRTNPFARGPQHLMNNAKDGFLPTVAPTSSPCWPVPASHIIAKASSPVELVPATVTNHEQEPKDVHHLSGVDSCQVLTVLNGKRLSLDANGKMHG
ncbi:hypothetical protein PGTUg99_015877 [Puccinia graminis f. sp. tritici]|uniref:Uncharacterized protein n=1 Tax=Puccinia graminis f. sp. tritici TaxID=56615 RepID=A0A5B0SHA4_PUCGR|nr:hypothetical protein PGTUg99_015877 [Puccinia graminis f. sp. tritici]